MFWTIWLLLAAILIVVLQQIDFILNPFVGILTALFMPLLIAGFLYYLLNPIVQLLERIKIKRVIGIALVMLMLVGILVFAVVVGIPMLIEQATNIVSGIPQFINQLEIYALRLGEEPWMQEINIAPILENLEVWLGDIGSRFLSGLVSGVGNLVQKYTDIAFMAITIPVILFYMLYDGWKFVPLVLDHTSTKYRKNVKDMLIQTDEVMSGYISGKGIASIIVGGLLFFLYTLAGIPSALLLSLFAAITNFIPFVGPFIGAAPAIIVGLVESRTLAVLAGLFVLIVQQLDSNLLTPFFVGKSLSIHPLTVILVLLASANIAGLLGMLIGVPVFVMIKTIGYYVARMVKENKVRKKTEPIQH